jgi:hypothetical protein
MARIQSDAKKVHKRSIFHDLIHPVQEKPEVTEIAVEEAEEAEAAVPEVTETTVSEIEMTDANQPKLPKKKYDAIHLSRNQFKIKYGKYGKGKKK